MPDREWLINTLFTLDPENDFFKFSKAKNEDEEKKEQ